MKHIRGWTRGPQPQAGVGNVHSILLLRRNACLVPRIAVHARSLVGPTVYPDASADPLQRRHGEAQGSRGLRERHGEVRLDDVAREGGWSSLASALRNGWRHGWPLKISIFAIFRADGRGCHAVSRSFSCASRSSSCS